MEKNYKMRYEKIKGEEECEGAVRNVFGIKLFQEWCSGTLGEMEIKNISADEAKIDFLLNIMERGMVTCMTASEIVEDFLEM